MRPVSQDVLRGLMAKGDSSNPELLALLQALASSATMDFVLPRYHLYEVYKNRMGLNYDPTPQDIVALDITAEYYEGMIQSVKAMAASSLANIRFLEVECLEASCALFVEENLKEVLGIIYFRHDNEVE
ncbi:hypothetical protein ACFST9_05775 [Hymenobacter monticola]|uniref:Uncharacterized protein n=1 Tax=Hymenobacter monticola TaxID=1705399 RepID=A0ABY4BAB9_9BACT|nr:hypothetical protein [Hymenobacter monticola]UOE36126.1 hypothetical protein MTP16_10905 [Hymenobacter monticola]